jgi:hypothetical protein
MLPRAPIMFDIGSLKSKSVIIQIFMPCSEPVSSEFPWSFSARACNDYVYCHFRVDYLTDST